MEKITILAKDYTQRVDLDDYVRNEIGEDINANRIAGHTIEGTADELKQLSLSEKTRVYGCKVVLLNN